MRKTLIAVFLVALAAAPVASSAAAPPKAPRTCRTLKHDDRWKAVFGHFSKRTPALSLAARLRSQGFVHAKVDNFGCGDYAVTLVGTDTQAIRNDFAAEAATAGFSGVTFQSTQNEKRTPPTGTLRAVFGTFPTVDEASALQQKAALVGFRLTDLEYVKPRTWRVTLLDIPTAKSRAFALEARSAGFEITYDIG